jgi:hypothetical protein
LRRGQAVLENESDRKSDAWRVSKLSLEKGKGSKKMLYSTSTPVWLRL